jgi:hypothetical protein
LDPKWRRLKENEESFTKRSFVVFTIKKCNCDNKLKEGEMASSHSTYGRNKKIQN